MMMMTIFKKKKKNRVPPMAEINNRIRGLIMDSQIQNSHEIAHILGLPAISDEIAEKEEQVSDDRVERIEYLIPILYAHAHTLAEASIEYQKSNVEDLDGLPKEMWVFGRKLLEQVSLSALIGSTSQLIDMGLLTIPKRIKK
jgi:hypothetical protein